MTVSPTRAASRSSTKKTGCMQANPFVGGSLMARGAGGSGLPVNGCPRVGRPSLLGKPAILVAKLVEIGAVDALEPYERILSAFDAAD